MGGTTSDWKDELGRWLELFLDRLDAKAVAAVRPPTPPPTTRTRLMSFMGCIAIRALQMPRALLLAQRELGLLDKGKRRACFRRQPGCGAHVTLAGENDARVAPTERSDKTVDGLV